MKKYGLNKCFQFGFAGLLGWLIVSIFTVKTQAQQSNIVPDNTLGAESSQVIDNFQGQPIEVITGGAIRQINLFHSFGEFNISEGRGAYFFSPNVEIRNILARVTGNNRSEILGTLGTFGGFQPNIFLINPNGIVFGENASLDLQGSFVGTTASGVQFGEQGNFSTINPQTPGLLTINPSALFFAQQQSGAITANQSLLGVAPGKNLALVGGDISLNSTTLQAFGGNLELAAIAGTGAVEINQDSSLSLPENLTRANASISNSLLDVAADNGGSVTINAGNLDISSSIIRAGIFSGLGTVDSQAGDITINTTGKLQIAPQSYIINWVFPNAIGKGGDIRINTDSMTFNDSSNSGYISASTGGKGDAGSVVVNAKNDISLNGSAISSTVEPDAVGNAGDIDISVNNLLLTGGGGLNTSTFGQGNGGKVIVNARDRVSIDGTDSQLRSSAILSRVQEKARGSAGNILIRAANQVSLKPNSLIASDVMPTAEGNGGNIDIIATSLLLDNALVRTASFGQGNAGNITIKVDDRVSLDRDAEIFSGVAQNAEGNGGNINLTTGSLLLDNKAKLSANTNGRGNAGNITIKAGDRVSLDNGAGIGSLISDEGIGKGGDIRISTGSLSIAGAAQLDSSTLGKGDAGDVIIDARDTVLFTGRRPDINLYSGILSTAEGEGKGNGGNIRISAGSVIVNDAARLSTYTVKKGNAGNISIQARDQLSVANLGQIQTVTSGEGDAGTISVTSGEFSLSNSSAFFSDTYAEGDAGDISIDVVKQVYLDKESVISSAVAGNAKGNGGTISINAESLSISNSSAFFSDTNAEGDAGDISIDVVKQVYLDKESVISNAVLGNARGNGGIIRIDAESLSITNGSQLQASTFGRGDAGDIRINARDLSMEKFATLVATTQGQGNSGDIFINASDRVSLDSRAIISNIVGKVENPGKFGDGKGGTIRIDTGSLSVANGSQLQASTFGRGDAGDIIINARDSFLASGFGESENRILPTAVFSVVTEDSRGNGGNIRVNTGSLFVEDGARLSTSTSGQGRAGNITIDARDAVVVDGISQVGFLSELSSATQEDATGGGGTITVNTNSFRVSNGGFVNAETTSAFRGGDVSINANTFEAVNGGQVGTNTSSSGNAGNIVLNVKDKVNLSGTGKGFRSGLFAGTFAESTGKGGSIFIDPRLVVIENGAGVSVGSDGTGDAGDITLQAGTLQLDKGFITAQTASTQGGNINLQISELLLLRNNSQISTTAGTAQAGGNGGNININSKFIVVPQSENSDITANAFSGNGGQVNINSSGIFGIETQQSLTEQSDVTASSQLGISGETNINTDDTSSIQNSFTELSPNIDTDAIIASSCIARSNKRQENSFKITGGGALPSNRPGNVFVSNYTTGEVRTVESRNQNWKKGDPIIEPQGLYRLSNGELLLSRECSD